MLHSRRPQSDEVEQLLRNAELRDELERYFDESISRVNVQQLPLSAENEFLACMLAWEQAPVLPIYRFYGKFSRVGLYNHRRGHSIPPLAERRVYEWLETYL